MMAHIKNALQLAFSRKMRLTDFINIQNKNIIKLLKIEVNRVKENQI